jgi:outer membrane protein OmpA-like peptidoglycan-associated protein
LGDLNASETPVDFPTGTLFPGSPPLSYGEIVALSGDFYGSFEHLADPNYINAEGKVVPNSTARKIREIEQLKRLFQVEAEIRAMGREPEGLDMGYVEHNGEVLEGFDKVTAGRYLALAERNFPHFTVAEGNNLSTWMAGHEQALTQAYLAGVAGDAQQFLLALARNAASNHFLTDAFASGHMRVPRSAIDVYYRNLMAEVVPGLTRELLERLPDEISLTLNLRRFIPDSVESVLDRVPNVDRYLSHHIEFEIRSRVEAAIGPYVTKFTSTMRDEVGPKLGGLVSKWLHDADNENGLLVTNQAGERWLAYGDASLDKTPPPLVDVTTTNRAEAEKAVAADRDEVQQMYDLGRANQQQRPPADGTSSVIPDAVYFDFDQPRGEDDASAIKAPSRAQLAGLAQYLLTVDGVTVQMEGWADSRGSDAYNQALATRRIGAVRACLIGAGVPAEKLATPVAHGEPIVATNARNHHAFGRVDVRIEGTPRPIGQDGGGGGEADVPIPHPFGAERYLPQVGPDNQPMQPYEWCHLTEQQKKTLRDGLKPIVKSGLTSLLEAAVQDSLPDDYDIDVTIPVPFVDDIHIQETISIQDLAMDAARPVINAGINGATSEVVLGNLLDGACSLSQ